MNYTHLQCTTIRPAGDFACTIRQNRNNDDGSLGVPKSGQS